MNKDKFSEPVGVGGWLLIPYYMLIVQIFQQGRSLFEAVLAVVSAPSSWSGLFVFETAISAAFMVWSALCVYLIFKRSRGVRLYCSRFFFACLIYPVLDLVWTSLCYPDYQILSGDYEIFFFVLGLVPPLIWGIYFLKSKRVANTFTPLVEERDVDKDAPAVIHPESLTEEQILKLALRRLVARVLDVAVVFLVLYALYQIVYGRVASWYICLTWTRYGLAFDCVMYALFGQTLGKCLFGLRVVRPDGGRLTRKQYFFRSCNALFFLGWPLMFLPGHCSSWRLLWVLSALSLVVCVGYQYVKVLNTGRTSYDAVYDLKVEGMALSRKQLGSAILVLTGTVALTVYQLLRSAD